MKKKARMFRGATITMQEIQRAVKRMKEFNAKDTRTFIEISSPWPKLKKR